MGKITRQGHKDKDNRDKITRQGHNKDNRDKITRQGHNKDKDKVATNEMDGSCQHT